VILVLVGVENICTVLIEHAADARHQALAIRTVDQ
jgi:hypothetical protein